MAQCNGCGKPMHPDDLDIHGNCEECADNYCEYCGGYGEPQMLICRFCNGEGCAMCGRRGETPCAECSPEPDYPEPVCA